MESLKGAESQKVDQRKVGFRKPVLAIVLAGGRGERLGPLTESRCKPNVPFGKNRLVDFSLANVINSQVVNHTMVLTQYMSQGLSNHLNLFNYNSHVWDKWVNTVPAQHQPDDKSWYVGTANAVYQNREMIKKDNSDIVVILAADHIYKLDIRQVLQKHYEHKSEFTVCGIVIPKQEAANNFGVMEVNAKSRIIGFEEKPAHPKSFPNQPDMCIASMGIYVVNKDFLLECLEVDHADVNSSHDFGKDILPRIIKQGKAVYSYNYNDNIIPGEKRIENGSEVTVHYWRDVGRISSYFEAVIDLTSVTPFLNTYNKLWPVPTAWDGLSGAKFVLPDKGATSELPNCIVAGDCIIDNFTRINQAVFSRSVRTEKWVDLDRVIAFDGVTIGANAKIRNTIIEEGVIVPANCRVGYDVDEDVAHGVYIDKFHDYTSHTEPIRIITKDAFQ